MAFFLQMVLSGFMLGGMYSLVALGFVIIYKASGVINFATGQMLAIGALTLWSFIVPFGFPIWTAFLITTLITALLGFGIERLTIRPMTGQPLMAIIVMTIGLAVLFDGLMYPIFGGPPRGYPRMFPTGGLGVWQLSISYEYLLSFIVAFCVVGIFLYFFHFTKQGILMRAVADGHDSARSCGIKVGGIFSLAWIIASICAMIGGFLLGSIEDVGPFMSKIGLTVFPVIILGGLESIPGCIIAGPIVGILRMLFIGYVDPITEGGAGDVVPHLIIFLALIFRPYGIFGQEQIERI